MPWIQIKVPVKPESFGESHLSPIGEYIYPRYKNYNVNLSFELNIDNINQLKLSLLKTKMLEKVKKYFENI